jgi:hypothetical protein
MFQETIKINENKNSFTIILAIIFFITTMIFLILFIKEKSKSPSLYKPDINNYIPIKEYLYENKIEGGKKLQGKYDILNTPYFGKIDFYNKKSDSNFQILENFKTYQQTSEYSCGCACIIMSLYYLNKTIISERDCVIKANTGTDIKNNTHGTIGTFPIDLEKAIINYGFDIESNRNFTNENSPINNELLFSNYIKDSIKKKEPIIILTPDWGGHYEVIVGYDNMGTENYIGDDVLIIADPYDSTDHIQDGFIVWNFIRYFYLLKVPVYFIEPEQNKLQFIRVKNRK